MAKKKRRSKRRGPKNITTMKQAMPLIAGGAAYGFLKENVPTFSTNIAKVPKLINRDITAGLALYMINKHVTKNKYVNGMAIAALTAGAVKLGEAKFSLEGEVGFDAQPDDELAGFGDAVDVGGIMTGNEDDIDFDDLD